MVTFLGTFNREMFVDARVNQARNPSRIILAVNRIARVDLVVIVVFQANLGESLRNLGDVRRNAP